MDHQPHSNPAPTCSYATAYQTLQQLLHPALPCLFRHAVNTFAACTVLTCLSSLANHASASFSILHVAQGYCTSGSHSIYSCLTSIHTPVSCPCPHARVTAIATVGTRALYYDYRECPRALNNCKALLLFTNSRMKHKFMINLRPRRHSIKQRPAIALRIQSHAISGYKDS